jgi:hypothetical protein
MPIKNNAMTSWWFTVLAVLIMIKSGINLIHQSRRERPFISMPPPLKPEEWTMSLEQARMMVDDLISKGEELSINPVDKTKLLPDGLGPITREFFSKYGALTIWGFELSAAEIQASDYIRGFLSIGHNEDWDIVQWPGTDEVFVVESAEAGLDLRFPSVYHLIVDTFYERY